MGDINFDLSKNKRFIFIPYTCAAIGAGITAFMAPAFIPGGIVANIALGAIAGGIGLPVLATIAAVGAIVLIAAGKELFKVAKKEGAMIPLGIGIIGYSSAKALFVTPFKALNSGLKKVFNSNAKPKNKPVSKAQNGLKPPKPNK